MAGLDRARIVAAARGWIGTPYHHQASAKGVGCDCLGLVRGIWRELVGPEPEPIPPYASDWSEATGRDALLEAGMRHFVGVDPGRMRAGDVAVFRWKPEWPAKHLAIVVEPHGLIHAYDAAGAVVEAPFAAAWRRRLAAAFRFPGVTD